LYTEVKDAGNYSWTDDSGDGIKEPLLDVSSTSVFSPVLIAGSAGGTTNNPPVASFTYKCTNLTCDFTDTSTDSDGSIASRSWSFGDGGTSTAQNPSHTYAAANAYEVSLAVTDDDGSTATTTKSVAVTEPSEGITLNVSAYKVKGVKHADLTWSGATSTDVDVYRAGQKIVTTSNDGEYTDNLNSKGGGSATYKVCEAGTSTCSSEVTVSW
jgi:serine protease